MNQTTLTGRTGKRSATAVAVACSDLVAAPNSCVRCSHEKTCGYSPLAMLGHRHEGSYDACCLGMMSCGKPFFDPKPKAATEKDHAQRPAPLTPKSTK